MIVKREKESDDVRNGDRQQKNGEGQNESDGEMNENNGEQNESDGEVKVKNLYDLSIHDGKMENNYMNFVGLEHAYNENDEGLENLKSINRSDKNSFSFLGNDNKYLMKRINELEVFLNEKSKMISDITKEKETQQKIQNFLIDKKEKEIKELKEILEKKNR